MRGCLPGGDSGTCWLLIACLNFARGGVDRHRVAPENPAVAIDVQDDVINRIVPEERAVGSRRRVESCAGIKSALGLLELQSGGGRRGGGRRGRCEEARARCMGGGRQS